MKKCIFLDRDGTIIVDKDYLHDPDEVELLPQAVQGLRLFRKLGYLLVVVSNQSGIGRGYFTENDVLRVNERLVEILRRHQISIDGIYYCPHAPEENCSCRKPRIGLVKQAQQEHQIDCSLSFVIGDKTADIGLGRNINAGTVLVRTGYGRITEQSSRCTPDIVVEDLSDAAEYVKLCSRGR